MRIIRAAVRRRYARLRTNARRKRDRRRMLAAQRRPPVMVRRRPSIVARVLRFLGLGFLASLLAACGATVPRGDVGEGGIVRGLVEACGRLGVLADAGAPDATWLFNNVCAPFFGWAPVPPPMPGDASPCVRGCLNQSQAEARAWEAIVADCRIRCAGGDNDGR